MVRWGTTYNESKGKEELIPLHEFHYENCPEFRKIVDHSGQKA